MPSKPSQTLVFINWGLDTVWLDNHPKRIALWKASINQISTFTQEKIQLTSFNDLQTYYSLSIKRTEFLGRWWMFALLNSGEIELSKLISQIYPRCALAGQLRNDLRNASTRETIKGGNQFSDFSDGRITALTAAVMNNVCREDKEWIQHTIWGKRSNISHKEVRKLANICLRSGAIEKLKKQIVTIVKSMVKDLRLSPISVDNKNIWEAWILRQFLCGVSLDYNEHHPISPIFVTSIKQFIED